MKNGKRPTVKQWQDIHFCPTHVLIANGWVRKDGEQDE